MDSEASQMGLISRSESKNIHLPVSLAFQWLYIGNYFMTGDMCGCL